ncbi:MAG: thiamine phosphate synthase, partial [Sphingopyxis sp.]|nr:thiamine phosphate synthase [Sphingopyxis sp.]
MPYCHHPNHGWLLTDARLAGHGLAAARRLPPGSVIIVRSDALQCRERIRLFRQLRRVARARRCLIYIAGATPGAALRLGTDGLHLRDRSRVSAARARRLGLRVSMPVHNRREAAAAARAHTNHALISPLYPTRSHAGTASLSLRQWLTLARQAQAVPVALGGMTA